MSSIGRADRIHGDIRTQVSSGEGTRFDRQLSREDYWHHPADASADHRRKHKLKGETPHHHHYHRLLYGTPITKYI